MALHQDHQYLDQGIKMHLMLKTYGCVFPFGLSVIDLQCVNTWKFMTQSMYTLALSHTQTFPL